MGIFSRGRSSITGRIAQVGIILTLLAPWRTGSAHQLDEYLQAAQVSIDPAEITLDLYLTPGIAVAETIIAAIDANHDGAISSEEGTAYATQALGKCVLSLDGRQLAMTLVADEYPSTDDMRKGIGTIHINAIAAEARSRGGSHVVIFENHIDPRRSVYLTNAMLPRNPGITIRKQDRDSSQSRIAISYDLVVAESKSSPPLWLLVGTAAAGGSIFLMMCRKRLVY